MKKEDFLSFIVYLIILVATISIGSVTLIPALQSYDGHINQIIFVLLAFVFASIVNVIGMELLHGLGAKIGGYEVASFNFLGACFEKKNGKWKLSHKDYDGFTGETRITPKSEKSNLKPFVWAPLFGYLVEFAIVVLINSTVGKSFVWVKCFGIVVLFVASICEFYNIIPLKLDSMNDGYRLVLISKPENMEAFNELMRVENLQRNGEKVGKIKVFSQINDFTASVNLLSVYENLNDKKYDDAMKIIESMLEDSSKLPFEAYNRLIAQKIYILILHNGEEEAKKYYETIKDDVRRFIANDNSCESLRAYAVIAGFLDESESEVAFIINKFPKIVKKALPSRANIENQLFNEAIDKVKAKHPDWLK